MAVTGGGSLGGAGRGHRNVRKISAYGLSLLRDGDGLLTHCNAGELATSRYGTGLGPILLGKEKGYNFKVFSDETRPLLQGAPAHQL